MSASRTYTCTQSPLNYTRPVRATRTRFQNLNLQVHYTPSPRERNTVENLTNFSFRSYIHCSYPLLLASFQSERYRPIRSQVQLRSSHHSSRAFQTTERDEIRVSNKIENSPDKTWIIKCKRNKRSKYLWFNHLWLSCSFQQVNKRYNTWQFSTKSNSRPYTFLVPCYQRFSGFVSAFETSFVVAVVVGGGVFFERGSQMSWKSLFLAKFLKTRSDNIA